MTGGIAGGSGEGLRLALAGDTMLGRKVAEALETRTPQTLFAPDLVEIAQEADLFVLNLECCVSERGERWPDPSKPFFFRAPPQAVEALLMLGVDCVTLANNHALDYGRTALEDTLSHLSDAGIAVVGAGRDLDQARRPVVLQRDGFRLKVIGLTDHPQDFRATSDRAGVAFADLRGGVPDWVFSSIAQSCEDAVLVTPHWGPNMVARPLRYVRRAAAEIVDGGATLVAGHSAHVFQGVDRNVLFDLGDFIDDYAVDPQLRNDLGLIFMVDLTGQGVRRVEAIPLALDYCHTRLAQGEETEWIRGRFTRACAEFGTQVLIEGERLVIDMAG